jgi:dTDP-4-dehydrorhamnose 3,5-epimerase
MTVLPAPELPDILVVEPRVFRDDRGFFVETYHAPRYRAAGIDVAFVQDNHSRSTRGTLRGLHWQVAPHAQAKLIRVLAGEILDVAVDIREESPTCGRWTAVTLSADNFRQLFIPVGFAHGFLVLSDVADVEYKCSDVYDPASERGIMWNDPTLGIVWPTADPILSARDQAHPPFAAALRVAARRAAPPRAQRGE